MSVSPDDTLRHLRSLLAERERRAEDRARRLIDGLPRARDVLLGKFGARRVWVFGSLATGSVTDDSDVDLGVEGLASEPYFGALADLMTIFGAPVDLVRVEEAPESLRQRILEEGRLL